MPRIKKKKESLESAKQSNLHFYVIIMLLLIQTVFLFYKNYDFIKEQLKPDPNLSYLDDVEQKQKTLQTNMKTESEILNPKNIRINILNGCGAPGIAAVWKQKLRELDYDIRETGNANKKYNKTVILSRTEDMRYSRQLAKTLGISEDNVIMQINNDLVDIDITLIVGSDHNEFEN